MAAKLQLLIAVSIAQKAVVADAVESTGENVEQESPDELPGRDGHNFLLVIVSIVPPPEADLAAFDIHDPMVGNSDTVRVAPDVIHHLLGSREGRLGVDDPFDIADTIEVAAEDPGIPKGLK
jgi:hypothetical protein